MPLAPTCPNCKSVVEVPADHFEATIRCGICWAEVIVERPPVVAKEEFLEKLVEAPPTPVSRPFSDFPGRPAKGMEPLEPLLAEVTLRLPHLLNVPKAKASKIATVPVEEPVVQNKPVARRREEDGLRRKRGQTSSLPMNPEDLPPAHPLNFSNLLLLLLVTIVVFIAGYFLMR